VAQLFSLTDIPLFRPVSVSANPRSIHPFTHQIVVAGYLASLGKVFKPMMKLCDYPFVHHENDVDLVWIQAKDRRETYENNPNTGNVRWRKPYLQDYFCRYSSGQAR